MTRLTDTVLTRDNSELYENLFQTCPHGFVQQSLAWSDIISPLSNDKLYIIVVSDLSGSPIAGLPLYHFQGEIGGILTSVPHAGPLGGVLCKKDIDEDVKKEVYSRLTVKAADLAESLGCIAWTVITSPFEMDDGYYQTEIRPQYVFNNFCQVIDLKGQFKGDGLFDTGKSSQNGRIRRNIRKAQNNGVVIEWGGQADFERWYQIHTERHTDIGVTPLPKALLKGVIDILEPKDLGGLIVAKINGEIVGGGIYVWHKDVVDAFMPSYLTESLNLGVNYSVTDFALNYFREKGMKWFNFQASYRESGVYVFKRRWGSLDKDYKFLTWTLDGFERIFNYNKWDISRMYEWHYVAPFEAIDKKLTSGTFDKQTKPVETVHE